MFPWTSMQAGRRYYEGCTVPAGSLRRSSARGVAGELETWSGLDDDRGGEGLVWRRCGGEEEADSDSVEVLEARRSHAWSCRSQRRKWNQRPNRGSKLRGRV